MNKYRNFLYIEHGKKRYRANLNDALNLDTIVLLSITFLLLKLLLSGNRKNEVVHEDQNQFPCFPPIKAEKKKCKKYYDKLS